MDSFLLYADKSSTGEVPYPSFQDIYKDLNLNIILKTMAQDDVFMMEQIRNVIMVPIRKREELLYRYEIVRDFYDNPELIQTLYEYAGKGFRLADQYKKEMEQNRRKATAKTSSIISSLNFITDSVALLRQIRDSLTHEKYTLKSNGLCRLAERLSGYPLDEFSKFHDQLLFYITGGEGIFSIQMSGGLKLESSHLQSCQNIRGNSLTGTYKKLLKFYYKVAKKDTILIENEALKKDIQTFIESNMQHIVEVYQPLIQDFIKFSFDYSKEIAFYCGVNNIQRRMKELSLPLCYAEVSNDNNHHELKNLYELSLALYTQTYPVPNSQKSENTVLTVITGANQGGKSTFLRSFGIAQVMMQCGMPVPAEQFCSGLFSKIHTHFTRKEDAMLSRGRLEEELKRMSNILSQLSADSLLLLNESFASTTEKEGSQIAYNIIIPLYRKGISVMMVTHLHEFARKIYEEQLPKTEFLVAERKENGERTFLMLPGKPHYSSYGTDLYEYMIGEL